MSGGNIELAVSPKCADHRMLFLEAHLYTVETLPHQDRLTEAVETHDLFLQVRKQTQEG